MDWIILPCFNNVSYFHIEMFNPAALHKKTVFLQPSKMKVFCFFQGATTLSPADLNVGEYLLRTMTVWQLLCFRLIDDAVWFPSIVLLTVKAF